MSDTVLAKDHAIALLKKLSSDDAFRQRYMQQPGAGLREVGVPPDAVAALPPSSTAPLTHLADKAFFADALVRLQRDEADCCTCQHPPTIRFRIGR